MDTTETKDQAEQVTPAANIEAIERALLKRLIYEPMQQPPESVTDADIIAAAAEREQEEHEKKLQELTDITKLIKSKQLTNGQRRDIAAILLRSAKAKNRLYTIDQLRLALPDAIDEINAIEQTESAASIEQLTDAIKAAADQRKKDAAAVLAAYSAGNAKERYNAITEMMRNAGTIPTGLTALDDAIGGGLYDGLFIIGAGTSVGKTALCMQIADYIALDRPVIYYSLEMSDIELIGRSLCRIAKEESGVSLTYAELTNEYHAKIANGNEINILPLDKEEQKAIQNAKKLYFNSKNQLIIRQAEPGAADLASIVTQYEQLAAALDRAPVLFIDYLQIIQPSEEQAAHRLTEKQIIDENILTLKQLSRKYRIPVIAISSYNRGQSQSFNPDITANKESGAIEYSADAVLALSLYCGSKAISYEENKNAAAAIGKQSIKPVRLAILKNRRGRRDITTYLQFDAPCFLFKTMTENEARTLADSIINSAGIQTKAEKQQSKS